MRGTLKSKGLPCGVLHTVCGTPRRIKCKDWLVGVVHAVRRQHSCGESPHALATRHGISRNLIKNWVAKYEAGGLDSDAAAADVLADYEARIAALERLVGKLALENEFLKGASRPVRQPRSASTSVVAGPLVSQSQKDAG